MADYEKPEGDEPERDEDEGGMSEDAFASEVGALVTDAIDYIDMHIAPDRIAATKYYRGDPFGNEEDGRSQVVMTEVRDVVQAMLPPLLRIFCGSERVVEFTPRTELDVPVAEQMTDWVDYTFYTENNGFTVLWNAIKDALVRKTGVITWYVSKTRSFEELDYSGLTQEEIDLLTQDDDVEVLEMTPAEAPEQPDPYLANMGVQEPPPEPAFDVRVRKYCDEKRIKVESVAPEDFFISRDAIDEDKTAAIGTRRDLTVSELVDMGYDQAEIEAYMGSEDAQDRNGEKQARNPAFIDRENDTHDEATKKVSYFEAYVRVDKDGDGIAELRRVCGIGHSKPHILHDEVWGDGAPYAILCPDPEPHTAIGYSIADQVADLQEIKSNVMRNTLDSLANAIHPRTVIVEGQVNTDDALNTEIGAVIRAKQPGMVQELAKPFVGQYSLPVLAYLDDTKARRTGTTDGPNAGDAQALQSTTKDAVTATVAASQERIELIARLFAEGGLRRMFRGVVKLATRHLDKEQVIRLRKKFVTVDPRSWKSDLDVVVNIGLGKFSVQDRIQLYAGIAAKQEQAIQTLGMDNPLAGLVEYRNTLAKMCEIGGEPDVGSYFKRIDPQQLQQMMQQQAQGQQQNPALILAQIEQKKVENQGQEIQLKHVRDVQKQQAEMALERERLAMERELRLAEIEAKYGVQLNVKAIDAAIQRERDTGQIVADLHDADMQRSHEAAQADAQRAHEAAQATADRLMQAHDGAQQRAHDAEQQDANRQAQAQQAAMSAAQSGGGDGGD